MLQRTNTALGSPLGGLAPCKMGGLPCGWLRPGRRRGKGQTAQTGEFVARGCPVSAPWPNRSQSEKADYVDLGDTAVVVDHNRHLERELVAVCVKDEWEMQPSTEHTPSLSHPSQKAKPQMHVGSCTGHTS